MSKVLQKKSAPKSGARFHVPQKLGNGSDVRLPEAAAHHAVRVLRLGVGDPVSVFDGFGGEFEARITRIEKGEVGIKTGAHFAIERESTLEVLLAQGLSSGERMDYTLQKAVELGVSAVQPVSTERSVVKLSADRAARRTEHWQNLVRSACEQCGRNRVPEVAAPQALDHWLASLTSPPTLNETRFLLSPNSELSLREMARPAGRVILLAGPEGGLTANEMQLAQSCGFAPLRLGPRVLRTETAGIAALAAMQALWGDF
jgi:16S rRNA (uracil1498-N3)-methyltransferase